MAIEPPSTNLLRLDDTLDDPYDPLDDPFDHPPITAPPKQKTFTVDVFKDIDKNLLSKYNIPTKFNSKAEIDNILSK